MTHYTVVLDDEDRSDAPDRPWIANIYKGLDTSQNEEPIAVGVGATPADALRDLASSREARARLIS